eukprot:TRINITY_DN11528_c0_g1_i1.p1 TRINITY_DN11528_c0_g1~~TRINITY_DN11528_c0_g1_i1.p1  ORF type:complete len:348 (+),score=51.41 TRINITY_DN11528_c0_g1_i1:148-1191(+)
MRRTAVLRAERAIFDLVGDFAKEIEYHDVHLDSTTYIHMTRCGNEKNPVLVLLHGYGTCNAYFAPILPKLAQHYNIYCLDHPGAGLSSRDPKDFTSTEECLDYFVDSLELWRKKVGLTSFFLGGHSFGGFVAGAYALKHGTYVKALLLISPGGITKQTPLSDEEIRKSRKKRNAFWWVVDRLEDFVWKRKVTPYDIFRKLSCAIKPILKLSFRYRFSRIPKGEADRYFNYFYESLKLERGTERAMFWLFDKGMRAQYPLEDLIREELRKTPIVFYYGEFDWMNQDGARRVVESGETLSILRIISHSSHKITIENPNELAEDILKFIESASFGQHEFEKRMEGSRPIG